MNIALTHKRISTSTPGVWSKAEREAWKLPEELTVSEWADKNIILPETSSEPGPYKTSRTPYMRQIMDCFINPDIEIITICKPNQVGVTQGLQNTIGYAIDEDPGPVLYVLPRDTDSNYFADKKIRPMIEDSPTLLAHTTGRIWDLSKESFDFDRMSIYYSASNSSAGLEIKEIRYLYFDEPEDYPVWTGKKPNPVKQGEKRTITFWDRKIYRAGKPRTTDGFMASEIKKSELHREKH
jgi:phage terminase large subunit GpA-like protein